MRNVLPLLLLLGCESGNRGSITFSVEDVGQGALDILWVLDNSVSMDDEQRWLDGTAARFFEGFRDAGTHIGVTTTDVETGASLDWVDASCAFDATCLADFAVHLDVGTDGSDLEQGLGAGLIGLTAPSTDATRGEFLRPGGRHVVIVLSDENDCTGDLGEPAIGEDCYVYANRLTPVDDLLTALLDVDPAGRVQVSGILGPDIVADCEATVPGRRYWEAIERTGGVLYSVCGAVDEGFASVAAGAAGSPRHFRLPEPVDPESLVVIVGEDHVVPEDEADGWSYDAPLRMLSLHGEAIPVAGEIVRVQFIPA